MGSMRNEQGIDDRNSLSVADPADALVLTEEDLGAVVGGVMYDSDPCEGGEGK